MPLWVVWRAELEDWKPKNVPYNPHCAHLSFMQPRASVKIPKSWGSLDNALTALQSGHYSGLGFVISQPLVMMDLDHPEAVQDAVLQRLLSGDTTGYNSRSIADIVLVLKLLHWMGDSVELNRKLFLASGLYREGKTLRKTGQTTNLDMTITKALKKRRNPPMKW